MLLLFRLIFYIIQKILFAIRLNTLHLLPFYQFFSYKIGLLPFDCFFFKKVRKEKDPKNCKHNKKLNYYDQPQGFTYRHVSKAIIV